MVNSIIDESEWNNLLDSDEYVKWSGKPEKYDGIHITYVGFGIFIIVLSIKFVYDIVTQICTLNSFSSVFNFVFILITDLIMVSFAFSFFVINYLIKSNTKYAVTNKKVIMKLGKMTKSVILDPMPQITMSSINMKGCGNITVGIPQFISRDDSGIMELLPWANKGSVLIYNVKEPEKVYTIITG